MKIAILTTDNRDYERDYAAPEPRFGTAPEALLQGLAQLPEAEVHVVSCVRQPVRSPKIIGPNIFFHSVVVPKIGWMRTLYQGCIRAKRKKLGEIQPDIVHGQGTELDCGISAVFSGLPNVVTIHGNMQAVAQMFGSRIGSFHWLAARLETLTLRRTSGVFCNSAYTEGLVAPRTRKTWRVPNALRCDFFNTEPKRAVCQPVLLNIGGMLPYKQTVEMLAMARRLHQRGCQFEMQFAGDRAAHTDYGKTFARELAKAESAGYARHLGTLNTAQLIAAMDAASALVHFPTEEAFGLVVAEALARNLKLFCAATGGVTDIATGAEAAELFKASDFSGLEDAIARWIREGCPRPTTTADTMCERYHPMVIARRHLEIYREVLKQNR